MPDEQGIEGQPMAELSAGRERVGDLDAPSAPAMLSMERDSLLSGLRSVNEQLVLSSVQVQRLAQASERQAAELAAVISSMADAVIIYGPAGEIVRMNPAAERMFGYSAAELELPLAERLSLSILQEESDGRPVPMEERVVFLALKGETVRGRVANLRRPGRSIWVSMSGAPLRNAGGAQIGAVVTFSDITAEHNLQEQRDDLVRAISHDLRSPLAAMQGQAQMLQRMLEQITDNARVKRSVDAIIVGARRMNAMIQDLVDSTRLESGQLHLDMQPTKLADFLSDLLHRSTDVLETARVRVDLPVDLPALEADPNRLERIVQNLLSNALKYSDPDSEVVVGAESMGEQVRIFVRDKGVGIPAQDQPHVFERYFRAQRIRKAEGLGLGLYITRMLVEAHGGKIWVESEPDIGTTFSFTLPVTRSCGTAEGSVVD